jgi:hypothetical protein
MTPLEKQSFEILTSINEHLETQNALLRRWLRVMVEGWKNDDLSEADFERASELTEVLQSPSQKDLS